MKNSVIYLGIALITFTNVISALGQQSFIIGESLTQTTQSNARLDQGNHSSERNSNEGENSESDNSETIFIPTYQKTMEEIIAENNQIIESTTLPAQSSEEENQIYIPESNLVSPEKAMEERILQDNLIIEGTALNATKKEQK